MRQAQATPIQAAPAALGHGIAEAAAAVDPQVFVTWGREVGWFQGSLFDVQAPGERDTRVA